MSELCCVCEAVGTGNGLVQWEKTEPVDTGLVAFVSGGLRPHHMGDAYADGLVG